MADIKDISASIASALDEAGVNGTVDIEMDGEHVAASVGHPTEDDVDLAVVVTPRGPATKPKAPTL
jgi:hypothetical protein